MSARQSARVAERSNRREPERTARREQTSCHSRHRRSGPRSRFRHRGPEPVPQSEQVGRSGMWSFLVSQAWPTRPGLADHPDFPDSTGCLIVARLAAVLLARLDRERPSPKLGHKREDKRDQLVAVGPPVLDLHILVAVLWQTP